jgi:hypothetical protein
MSSRSRGGSRIQVDGISPTPWLGSLQVNLTNEKAAK